MIEQLRFVETARMERERELVRFRRDWAHRRNKYDPVRAKFIHLLMKAVQELKIFGRW